VPGGFVATRLANIDLDNDGDLDIISSVILGDEHVKEEQVAGEVYLFRNNQEHGFAAEATGIIGSSRNIIIDDFNSDGLADASFTEHGYDFPPFPGHTDYLFFQTAIGKLVDVTTSNLPPIQDFAHSSCAGDFDMNGGLDIMTTNGGTFKLLMNDGDGVFADEKEARLPLSVISIDYIIENGLQNSIPPDEHEDLFYSWWWCASINVDGDSDVDIVLGGANSDGKRTLDGDDLSHKHVILFNDGLGHFSYDSARSRIQSTTVASATLEPAVTIMGVDDFNTDGCQDLISASTNYETQQDTNFFLNDCSGTFSLVYSETTDLLSADYFEAEDLNQDGVTDYLIYNEVPGVSRVYFSDLGSISSRPIDANDLYNLSPAAFLKLSEQFP
jgi:hypothetical protein